MTTVDLRTDVAVSGPGTHSLPTLGARYTVGRDHVRAAVRELLRRTPVLAVDIETYGLGALAVHLKVVVLASADWSIVCDPRDPLQAEAIRFALAEARTLVIHNSTYDVPPLVRNGLMTINQIGKVVDTLVYARLAEPDERTSKSLGAAAARYLGTSKTDMLDQAFKAAGVKKSDGYVVFDLDRPVYVLGAAIDGVVTARLLPLVRAAARERTASGHPDSGGPFAWALTGSDVDELVEREQTVNRAMLRRSARGLRVDLDYADEYRRQVGHELTAARDVLAEAGVAEGNVNSLTSWLTERDAIPAAYPRTPKTGAPSGQADHLALLGHPVARAFVTAKKLVKVGHDYLDKVVELADERGRVYPQVSILGATTGRMSMSTPPFHQFPGDKLDDDGRVLARGARGIVLADEGDGLTSIDWSQIEPVVGACVARDTGVLEAYEAGTSDVYTEIARLAGIDRKRAKVVLLAQMYGEGMTSLALKLGITVDDAWALRRAVFRPMPKVEALIGKLRLIGKQHRMIYTLAGRIVPVPMGSYTDPATGVTRRDVQAHKAVNYFIQGSAYDVLADVIVRLEAAGLGDAIYLAMHDELVVSTAAAEDVRRIMAEPPERLCRMAGRRPTLRTDMADLGDRWAAA